MRLNKKDILLLVIPLIIIAVIYPFLPTQIPRQFHSNGEISYMQKEFLFVLGLFPYAIYKYRYARGQK